MRAALVSVVVYATITAAMSVDVLGALGTAIANDAGDPLFTAAILTWNAQHLPGTEAWWQLPIFHPTADTLAFSEHLLGVSVLATPLYWLSGSTLTAYNVTFLLTYPLCGLAMYALAYRLTRSAGAAFLAGLAYAFAPYRASQLAHIQLLAAFYLPLQLVGLHAFRESGQRRWLALFGICWLLQGAASGYFLIYGTVLVGFWILWFAVAPGRWRDAASIAAALAAAAVPLAPILYRYTEVHARHGFVRYFGEAAYYGADLASVLCAPTQLTFWGGWLRIGCKPEGELFPGAALVALCAAGATVALTTRRTANAPEPAATPGALRFAAARVYVRRALLVLSACFGLVAITALVTGGWQIAAGPLRASASSPMKPFSSAMYLLLGALLLSPGLAAAARRSSIPVFYVLAAAGSWVLSWGTAPTLLGTQVLYQAPFAWLMRMPGGDSLRVSARFWLIVVVCASVLLALILAQALKHRTTGVKRAILAVAAAGLLADGWVRIRTAPVPAVPPRADHLRGTVVLELPLGGALGDLAAEYRAITGGWRTINGFSGYEPAYYAALREASTNASEAVLARPADGADLHVLVSEDATGLRRMVERAPGARFVGRGDGVTQYVLTTPVSP